MRPIQYIVNGGEKPRNCPFLLGLRHPDGGGPSHSYRQHAQEKVKIASVVREMCSQTERHTHRQTDTQTCSLQYFAIAPASKVTRT